MKKRFNSAKTKSFQRERARAELRRRQTKRVRAGQRDPTERDRLRRQHKQIWSQKEVHIEAPNPFSIARNPSAVLRFIREIRRTNGRHRTYIHLKDLTDIDPEAVALFVASMKDYDELFVHGDSPSDPNAAARLRGFGFYEHVKGPNYTGKTGSIRRQHHGKRVPSQVVKEIIDFAAAHMGAPISSPGLQASFRTMIEALSNTFQHADQHGTGNVPWWASVFVDEDRGLLCFTAIDLGLGILRSRGLRQKFESRLSVPAVNSFWGHHGAVIESILQGKISSRTSQKHRGRGLPSFDAAFNRQQINNLIVMSNHGYINRGNSSTLHLPEKLPGTLIYWEVKSVDDPSGHAKDSCG